MKQRLSDGLPYPLAYLPGLRQSFGLTQPQISLTFLLDSSASCACFTLASEGHSDHHGHCQWKLTQGLVDLLNPALSCRYQYAFVLQNYLPVYSSCLPALWALSYSTSQETVVLQRVFNQLPEVPNVKSLFKCLSIHPSIQLDPY